MDKTGLTTEVFESPDDEDMSMLVQAKLQRMVPSKMGSKQKNWQKGGMLSKTKLMNEQKWS
jgi:hypothetical protein